MTGPGTNTYLVGEEELAVIDPGPAIDSHIEKILAAGKIRWILCTHTHMDHSPAAAALKKATGATILGRRAPAGQDASFAPDEVLSHGQRLLLAGVSLRASIRRAMPRTTSAICWKTRACSSPATT